MGWVKDALFALKREGVAVVRPQGRSMAGRIENGQQVTLRSVKGHEVEVDDVIFIRWKGNYILHIAKEVNETEILIGNNLGKLNGWIAKEDVIARVES